MKARLDAVHPVLMSRDVAASVRFYERLGFALSFEDDPAAPKYAAVWRDGVVLHLQWADETQWAYPIDRPAYRFLVRDVDGLFAELRDNGVVDAEGAGPWSAPKETPWGTREFHLRDPGGSSLQFYWPLPDHAE